MMHGDKPARATLDLRYAEALYQYAQVLRKLDKPAEAEAQLAAFREITTKEPPRNRP